MATKIIPKKSTVSEKIPASTDLDVGEIAINLTDAKLYAKHSDNSIVNLSGAPELHTHSISQVTNLQTSLDAKVDDSTYTAADVKTKYESNTNTNAYTDSEKTKLAGIATSADDYGSWTISDGVNSEAIASGNTVTINGSGATSATYDPASNVLTISSTDTNTTYTAGTGISLTGTTLSLTNEVYTSAEKNKLGGIESGATADQTASEILTALKTVDGSGSGLDADTLDGIGSASFVRDTGDTLTGTYTINTTDDGVNDLQVGGTSRFQGNAGFGDSSPDERVDVAGNARIQNENAMKFGGTGATDAQFAIQYNAATKSLDFNMIGG